MSRLRSAAGVVVLVARATTKHDIKYPAAAFAYYAFVGFLPLLVLVVALFGETYVAQVQQVTPLLLTPAAQQLVTDSLTTASGRAGATVFAVVVLAWSVTNMTTSIQAVVERLEGSGKREYSEQLYDAVSVLCTLILAIVSIPFAGWFLVVFSPVDVLVRGWPVVLFGMLVVAFVPLYYVPSRRAADPWAALPGAVTAAFGWTVLVVAIQFYATHASRYALYGVLSGIIIIFTALYLAAGVLMVGIVVNATTQAM